MKSVVFLLIAICAIQTIVARNPSHNRPEHKVPRQINNEPVVQKDDLRLNLQELVQKLIEAVSNAAQNAQNKLKELMERISEGLHGIEQNAIDAIGDLIQSIQQEIAEAHHAAECIIAHRDQIKNISREARENIRNCANRAREQLDEVHESLSPQRQSIQDEIDEIHDILTNCSSSNPIEAIGCLRNNAEAIRLSVQAIVQLVREAISIAGPQVDAIKENAAECIETAREDARSKLEDVLEEIRECGNNPPSPPPQSTQDPSDATETQGPSNITGTQNPSDVTEIVRPNA